MYCHFLWCCFLGAIIFACTSGTKFDYVNKCKWSELYPACGGKEQSPIPLYTKWLKKCEKTPMKFINFNSKLTVTTVNEGYALVDYFDAENGLIPTVQLFGNHYILLKASSHGGTVLTPGSEHTINDFRYAAEYITLFQNAKYCPETAANYRDGHLKIVRLCEVGIPDDPNNHNGWDELFDVLPSLITYNSSVTLTRRTTLREHLGLRTMSYGKGMPGYMYYGSITTPPCFPAINIVFNESLYVYNHKLPDIIKVQNKYGYPNSNNFRSLQEGHGRKVIGIC